jgi:hypothetical protein
MFPRLAATAVVLTALLSGCAMYYRIRPGQLQPATATVATEQRSVVWQRAVTVLVDQGFVPQLLNEAACFISARRRDDLNNDMLAGTMVLVAISPEGHLRLEVGGSGVFGSEQQFLHEVSELQSHLLRLVLGQSTPPPPR